MKERGILFRGPLVRALIAGDKTQTRRPVKPQPHRVVEHRERFVSTVDGTVHNIRVPDGWEWRKLYAADDGGKFAEALAQHCPYGSPGDRLWVRETHAMRHIDQPDVWFSTADIARVRAYGGGPATPGCHLRLDGNDVYIRYRAHPRTMEELAASPGFDNYAPTWDEPPRWRPGIHMPRWASRLTLSLSEIRVERVQDISEADARAEGLAHWARAHCEPGAAESMNPLELWRLAWTSIHGEDEWSRNPWCWALTFSVERTY